jgi:hypothetical protein
MDLQLNTSAEEVSIYGHRLFMFCRRWLNFDGRSRNGTHRPRAVSAGRGCMPDLACKFQVDLLPNGEEHKPDRNPYRNLEESVKRY